MAGERILLVDDEIQFVRTMEEILKQNNYSVSVAYDGKTALKKALQELPDVIILDLGIPQINGFEVCRQLKENTQTRFIPIIMLTGTLTESISRITGLKLGADEYLIKPCEPEELFVRIERLVEKSRELISAHPLTKLPGSALIETKVREMMLAKEDFCICYVDADHFKAYNDVYGYLQGNEVIIFISDIISETIKDLITDEALRKKILVGHIGGDDFLLVCLRETADALCSSITSKFDSRIVSFYSEIDRERKYIMTKDRQGNFQSFNLMSLSIAIIDIDQRNITDYGEIVVVLSEVKNYLKSIPNRQGSIYMKDRRK